MNAYLFNVDMKIGAGNQSSRVQLDILLEFYRSGGRQSQCPDMAVNLTLCDVTLNYLTDHQVLFRFLAHKTANTHYAYVHHVAVIFDTLNSRSYFL